MTYFSFDGCDFHFHDEEEEAKKNAVDALDEFRDEADDGWCELSSQVCWGIVIGKCQVTDERPATEDDGVDLDFVNVFQKREIVEDVLRPEENPFLRG